jgi:hypothetical protein
MKRVKPRLLINAGLFLFVTLVNSAQGWWPPTISTAANWVVLPIVMALATYATVRTKPSDFGEVSRALVVQAALWVGGFPTERFFNNARTLAVIVIVDLVFAVVRQELESAENSTTEAQPSAVST